MATAETFEVWGAEPIRKQAPFALRIPRNLYRFARRKPLGAFGGLLICILVFMAIFGAGFSIGPVKVPSVAPYHYNEYELLKDYLKGPSRSHIMGTDELGRDVFSRILYGARLSVFIGLGVFAISISLQTTITIISAYYVTSLDLILQRVIDIFGFLPDLVILISLMAIYGANPFTLIITLGVLNGINTSRVLRALVIGIRSLPYIEAAKSIGASDNRVIARHIFPNVAYYIIIQATGAISAAIAAEAGLAILELGLDPSYPTWGNMMNASRQFLRIAPHMAIAPGLMLALTIFGFRLLGDALRDVLDPRLRGSK